MLLLKFKDLTAIFFSILDKSEPFQKKNPYEYRQIIVLRWYVLALKYCVINIKELWILVSGSHTDDWDFGSWEDRITISTKPITENSFSEAL